MIETESIAFATERHVITKEIRCRNCGNLILDHDADFYSEGEIKCKCGTLNYFGITYR
jgi:phage FluMu protein Com